MYTVDEKDQVRALEGLPRSNVGAPQPLIVCNEWRTLVAYLVEERDPNWDGKTCRMVGPETEGLVALVQFVGRSAIMFGPPNDEAFSGHPLASRGLQPYGAYEVVESSWIRALERMNSVHPQHNARDYLLNRRHFILTFHDSTVECIATKLELVDTVRGSMSAAAKRMAEHLVPKARKLD